VRISRIWKRRLFRLALVILAALALEFALDISTSPLWPRMLQLRQLGEQYPPECLRLSDELGFEAIPNRCSRNEWGARVTGNPRRPPNGPRLLLLGDSIAQDHLFADRMQQHFDADPTLHGLEIWNAGVAGYNLYQEFQVLRRDFAAVRPQLILFEVCPNDAETFLDVVYLQPDTRRRFFRPDGSMKPLLVVLTKSRILDVLMFLLYGERPPASTRGEQFETSDVLKQIAAFSQSRGVPVALVAFPHLGSEPREHFAQQYRKLVSLLRASGMPYFLAETVLHPPLEQYCAIIGDPLHPNEKGHQLAGDGIVRFLREQKLIGGPDTSSAGAR